MGNVLLRILDAKQREVADAKRRVPPAEMQSRAADTPRPRNFYQALMSPAALGLHLIAEIKKASPSAGVIREDFHPETIAGWYQEAGASALSVLTDGQFFQGRLDYIDRVKKVVSLPVLRKDFIIDPYQLHEARAAGADAVLLIADALPIGLLSDLLILAGELHLTSLIEVHDADSLLRVRSMVGFPHERYSLLGINNRDLKAQVVDLRNTARLLDLLDDPKGVISESGIRTRQDVRWLTELGISGVLIGETLMRAPDPREKIRELFGEVQEQRGRRGFDGGRGPCV